jgi:hypothetical protein
MSGVVIRCPNCGITQSTLGECEACHEATTRYFCSNHDPGLWLDAPLCPTCGARPGVAGTRPQRTPSGRTTPPRATPPQRRTPARGEMRPREEAEDLETEPWRGPVHSPRDPREVDARMGDAPDAWRIDPSVLLPTAVRVASLFGCLRRLVVLAIVLFVLAVLAFFALFGVGGVFYNTVSVEPAPRYAVSGTTVAPNRAPSALRYALAVAEWPIMNRDTKRNTGL